LGGEGEEIKDIVLSTTQKPLVPHLEFHPTPTDSSPKKGRGPSVLMSDL